MYQGPCTQSMYWAPSGLDVLGRVQAKIQNMSEFELTLLVHSADLAVYLTSESLVNVGIHSDVLGLGPKPTQAWPI